MHKQVAVYLWIVVIPITLFSQNSITGTVVDISTGEPIVGASVFISNSSRGTISGKNGNFALSGIPSGQHDLVISYIGFETNVFSFNSITLPLKLKVEMRVKARELKSIIIEPFIEEGWDKWGKLFQERFIGETPNAQKCKIKNYKSIRFLFYRKSNRLVAYCDEPLVIENKGLGYMINFQLEDFEVNFSSNLTSYQGYSYFEDLDAAKGRQNRWQKARDQVYYGSTMHFFKSLFADSLAANQFELRKMVREYNLEKERVKPIFRSVMIARQPKNNIPADLNYIPLAEDAPEKSPDSIAYYEKVLRQKDYTDHYGSELIQADSILKAGEKDYKILYFGDYLYVTYKGAKEEKAYLEYHRETRKPLHQISFVWLATGQPIAVFANGTYYPPQELFSMSYWGWKEKISNMLPIDYQPVRQQKD